MQARRIAGLLGLLATAVMLAGCATQPGPGWPSTPGFFSGLFHGLVSPLALVGGLFLDLRVYAFPNSSWFYDLGFMLGLLPWAGGAASAS
jgi:hypothetical protein